MRNNTRTQKANRKLQSKVARLNEELRLLRYIANPMNRWFNQEYNKWAMSTPKHLKLVDAAELLKEYFKEHPFES